jgi:hypothetical protein
LRLDHEQCLYPGLGCCLLETALAAAVKINDSNIQVGNQILTVDDSTFHGASCRIESLREEIDICWHWIVLDYNLNSSRSFITRCKWAYEATIVTGRTASSSPRAAQDLSPKLHVKSEIGASVERGVLGRTQLRHVSSGFERRT